MNQATFDFIHCHIHDDVRQLALLSVPADVNLREALQQIEGRQLAARKLPTCAATDGFLFPPRLSLEQCSSEATADYKRQVISQALDTSLTASRSAAPCRCALHTSRPSHSVRRISDGFFADLTAGLGIDFTALAPLFSTALYVDNNPDLCDLARHNLPLLGLPNAEVRCSSAEDVLRQGIRTDLIMIDPARRNAAGRKVALIEDCTPDVCVLQDELLAASSHVLIKLSPMLDIAAALRVLRHVAEVHVVSVGGECKELLFLLSAKTTVAHPPITCVNLPSPDTYVFTREEESSAPLTFADSIGTFLYEPNASIMKAGAFRTLCQRFPVHKLSADAHLYTSEQLIADFPGRVWRVVASSFFNKRDLRAFLSDTRSAELTVRGFPASVAALRRQLHLSEGGRDHFIATTLTDNRRCLIKVDRYFQQQVTTE